MRKVLSGFAELGSRGGKARGKRLSAERRARIARLGGEARARSLVASRRRRIAARAAETRWEARRIARRMIENFHKVPILDMARYLNA